MLLNSTYTATLRARQAQQKHSRRSAGNDFRRSRGGSGDWNGWNGGCGGGGGSGGGGAGDDRGSGDVPHKSDATHAEHLGAGLSCAVETTDWH